MGAKNSISQQWLAPGHMNPVVKPMNSALLS